MTDAPSLAAALALPFVQNALAIAVLASVLCGVLGVFVVTKRVARVARPMARQAG